MDKRRKIAETLLNSSRLGQTESGFVHYLTDDERAYEKLSFKEISEDEFLALAFKRNKCSYKLNFKRTIRILSTLNIEEYLVNNGKLYIRGLFGRNEIVVIEYGIYCE